MRAPWFIAAIVATASLACDDEKTDYSWPPCSAPVVAGPFMVDATQIVGLTNLFSVSIHGTVDDHTIRSLDFENAAGTVTTSGGTAQGVLYDQYVASGFDGYTVVAPIADRWNILFPYCAGGRLHSVWHLDTISQRLRQLGANGTCTRSDELSVAGEISLPASTLNVSVLCGLEVEATAVEFLPSPPFTTGESISARRNQPGTAVRREPSTGDLIEQRFLPFAGVDCSGCAQPGWQEVHSVLWNGATRTAAYGILYLFGGHDRGFPDQGSEMLFDRFFQIPLGPVSAGTFSGTWKASP